MIELKLSIEDVNKILTALGKMQYTEVYLLINQIVEQSNSQIKK